MKYVCIQKGNSRIEFCVEAWESKWKYAITRMQNLHTGASVYTEHVTREQCAAIYNNAIAAGYHRFRTPREISWYATENENEKQYYHPSEEEWKIEGIYLIPIKSHVLQEQ